MSTNKIKYLGKLYDVPTWATYIAADNDGSIWVYDERPLMHKLGWSKRSPGNRTCTIGVDSDLEYMHSLTCQKIQGLIIPPKPRKPKVKPPVPKQEQPVTIKGRKMWIVVHPKDPTWYEVRFKKPMSTRYTFDGTWVDWQEGVFIPVS